MLMLFNSAPFLFLFLPLTLLGTFLMARLRRHWPAAGWLVLASLAFYGWDKPARLLPLIAVSVMFNFLVGRRIATTRRPAWLWLGVGGNLVWLGVFKYAGFVTANLAVLGLPVHAVRVVLPIGISFYTFTQIAFLVDAYRGEAKEYSLLDYTLFVTFFPHLIAGPILHHRETMPQLTRPGAFRLDAGCVAAGLSWFAAGMFKKVVLADHVGPVATGMFAAAARGEPISSAAAWQGALAYALQLYFDFSGYSDMAIGLALTVGVTFPLNFLSPYKATSLIDFWRRWNITLSRFLRDYLYIPLGGSRHGRMRRLLNLMLTMILGGLWHGAGWTFVVWGAMHGAGLVVDHVWREIAAPRGWRIPALLGQALTLLFVVFAWVPFRADSLTAAAHVWAAMLVPVSGPAAATGSLWVAALGAIALLTPNTAEIFGRAGPRPVPLWRPGTGAALLLGLCLGLAVSGSFSAPTAFLYYRF